MNTLVWLVLILLFTCASLADDHGDFLEDRYPDGAKQPSGVDSSFAGIFLPIVRAENELEGFRSSLDSSKGSKSNDPQTSQSEIGSKDAITGLIAHWSFDTCNAYDSGPYKNNGVIHGDPKCIDGVRGKALRFDGIDDYIEVENNPSLNPTDQLTLVAWYRPTRSFAGNGNNEILDKAFVAHEKPHYQYHLGVNGSLYSPERIPRAQGQFDAWVAIDNEPVAIDTGNDFWKPEQWYCLASSYDQETLRFFVNGDPVGQVRHPGRLSAYPTPLTIARNHNINRGEIDYTPGDMDDIQIYNRALSQLEIRQICTSVTLTNVLAVDQPVLTTVQETAAPTACLTNYYTGTIGLLPVRAWLYRNGDKIDGFYAYEKSRRYDPQTNRYKYRLIKLSGPVDAAGTVMLAETDDQARFTGRWKGIWNGERFSGEWRNAKGETPLAVGLQASTVFEDGEKPNFRLRLRPKLINVLDFHSSPYEKKRCEYAIVGVSFDGQPEIDLSRLEGYGFRPRKVDDEILSIVDSRYCGEGMSFHRWEGNPTLYQIRYRDPDYCGGSSWSMLAGDNSEFIPSGSGQPLLEFSISNDEIVHDGGAGGFWGGASYDFEYHGSRLSAIRNSVGEGIFCWFMGEQEEGCASRYGKLAESYVKGTAAYVTEYEIRRKGQTYVAEPVRRKTDGSPEEVLESDRTEIRLGEGDKGWKIAMNYMKKVTELLAYARTQRPDDGETEEVKARCELWNGNQLLEWKKPEGMAKKHPGAKAQEKTYDRFFDFLSDMSFLYTSNQRSIAVHWTGAGGKPDFSNLIGYYDSEHQICHSRFAESGEKSRKPLDKERYETLFKKGRKH